MNTSSEYTFPIFISSTDYNLKDLRAELARFLSELGYKPILSSAEGFPDNSPILEPWESCIPVLDKSFVMVLIIDGDYSNALKWPNFQEHFADRKISPTHGEYVYAHKFKKRMLVFIRKSLMPHYQSYRQTMQHFGNDREQAKQALKITLPKNVSFETLEFINEVKTTRPIPWINEFDDITSVKKEIQKKMLNELAELFLIKNKHAETVIESFNTVMDSLSRAEQKNALSKINATKGVMDAIEKSEELETELKVAKDELEANKSSNEVDRTKTKTKIKALESKIEELEKSTFLSPDSQFFLQDGNLKVKPITADDYIFKTTKDFTSGSLKNLGSVTFGSSSCQKCGNVEDGADSMLYNTFRACNKCGRKLCKNCWPVSVSALSNSYCPDCSLSSKVIITN